MEEDNKELHLNSLEIQNFRPFQHLKIERLGRVNLIVGKNSVGKSSVLDAINLYAQRGSPLLLQLILKKHKELNFTRLRDTWDNIWGSTVNIQLAALKDLFFGRKLDLKTLPITLHIGEVGTVQKQINIELGMYSLEETEDFGGKSRLLSLDGILTADNPRLAFSVQYGTDEPRISRLDKIRDFDIYDESPSASSIFVATGGLSETLIGDLWKAIALTDAEENVVKALQIIHPDVERVAVITRDGYKPESEYEVIVKVKGLNERLSLGSLGDGMNRIFGITLALVNSANDFLLIDEIENGLHYSVQLEVWKLIFEVARRLNVQVFATTHNWDCIEAFQEAAAADQQSEGMLIRLENKAGRMVTTLFDEDELAIVTREQIEVR
jgi:ABC-type branched-subunit amino acid transport system ATPase component